LTLDRDLEHPDITAAQRTGYPAGREPFWPICPICGEETDTVYKQIGTGNIVGCYNCIITIDAWDDPECMKGANNE